MNTEDCVKQVPLMIRFKRAMPNEPLEYRYDETLHLNVIRQEGRSVPAVQVPEVRLRMKTNAYAGGED